MASVNWEKMKNVGEIKGIARHCDINCRLQDYHENEHIDKTLTKYNVQMCDYETACRRIDDRITYLDGLPNQNKRKDRVIGFALEIPIPNDIPDGKAVDFLNKVNKLISEQIGADNILASYLHIDEVHNYVDSNTKQERISMRHCHTLVSAAIGGKLNARELSSKKNMIKLNKAIDEMCQRDYGVAFLTGEKTKSKESVQSLKLKSKALDLELREKTVEDKEKAIALNEMEIDKKRVALDKREAEINKRASKINEKRSELNEHIKTYNSKSKALRERTETLERKERQVDEQAKLNEEQAKQNELYLKQLQRMAAEIGKQIKIKNQVASLENKYSDIQGDLQAPDV